MRDSVLLVLAYHRIADHGSDAFLNPRNISATPSVFVKQLKHLARHYHVVSMAEVLGRLIDAKPFPPRAVLLTFDDAYCDFEEFAWPALKELRLAATMFVPSAYVGNPAKHFWWDRLYAAIKHSEKKALIFEGLGKLPLDSVEAKAGAISRVIDHVKTLPHEHAVCLMADLCEDLGVTESRVRSVLDWDELRRLAQAGLEIGIHTRNHPILTRISLEEVRMEIVESYNDVRRQIDAALPALAYPNGNFDDRVKQITEKAGIAAAFTIGRSGVNDFQHADPLALNRMHIGRRTGAAVFRARMLSSVQMHRFRFAIRACFKNPSGLTGG